MEETTELEQAILWTLHHKRLYGAKHPQMGNATRSGFPSHMREEVRKTILLLMRKNLVIWYDHGREAIQLNNEKTEEIRNILRDYRPS